MVKSGKSIERIEEDRDLARGEIIAAYLEFVKKSGKLPNFSDLMAAGISRAKVRHHFSNLDGLHNEIVDNYAADLAMYVAHEAVVFSNDKLDELREEIGKYKRFVITTAVNAKAVFKPFYDSIVSYCAKKEAKLLIIPCADIWDRSASMAWTFDPALGGESFIFVDTKLNDNLSISSIRMSAKQINPVTGMSRLGQRNGSFIFASPKQFLEFVMGSPDPDRLPHAIMTTGTITIPDYNTDRYMSERISYIAENDHTIGAVIVEIENDRIFHFRQMQADADGSFIDLGVRYAQDGSTKKVTTDIVLGDYHAGVTDEVVKKCTAEMCTELEVEDMFLHDFFDGKSISHHDLAQPLKLAMKADRDNQQNDLLKEIKIGGAEINWLHGLIRGGIVMVRGNHDEFLERYLYRGTYINDPTNHRLSLELAAKLHDGVNPLEYAYLTYGDIKDVDRVIWLDRDQEYKVGGVELGQHGDLGFNGSRGSLLSVEKAYANCVVGHTHSGAILRGVFRVGTSSKLRLDYNRGPSSWTQTHCLVYRNGSRQLVNVIDGKWRLPTVATTGKVKTKRRRADAVST